MNRFAFKWRVIEPWHAPDGISLFSHGGNIFTWADMLNTQASSPLGQYVAQVRSWGFNAMAVWGKPEQNPQAMRNFARYLKKNGIRMIIRRPWPEAERECIKPEAVGSTPRTWHKLCPYNEEVRGYWADRITRDFEMIPDLGGLCINCSEFYYANGTPWMCHCPTCRTQPPRERTRAAIQMMGKLLAARGGTLFWETCQDDPWGQRHEAQYFRDLTGEIPDNCFILIKRFYWDFVSRWPRHALYDTITTDARNLSPYVTSIQQPGEYQGVHDFPWSLVEEFGQAFRDMAATGQQGAWVMGLVHPDGWDHPLNMVNWYAIARYMSDPHADPAGLPLAWAREQFGDDAAPVVTAVVAKVTEAARGMFEFDTLWTANHSRFPTLEYLDSHISGPYRQTKRMAGMIGLILPLDMYSPERAAEIRADPRTRLAFNQMPMTAGLKAEAMEQKEAAVQLMRESIALWHSLEGKIDGATYHRVMSGLEGNLNDTIIFRSAMDLYMDWKLGTLTEEKINAALQKCRGLRGIVVPDALDENPKKVTNIEPASLATLARQLRRDLRKPWVENYWREHPLGAGVVDPIDWVAPESQD